MAQLRVVVAGAGGRMGAANIRAIAAHPGLVLHAAVDRAGAPDLGKDAGLLAGIGETGIPVTADFVQALEGADAVVEFTAPSATVEHVRLTAERRLVHVIGTTGCSADDQAAIADAGKAGARVVFSGNFSMGVVVLADLVRKAAAILEHYDIEILEMHHGKKVDAPSGTALLPGEAAAAGRGVDLDAQSVRGRDGHTGTRQQGTIGFASLRGGTVVGDHSVILAGPSERIELNHRAEDRAIFANGAMRAMLWAHEQQPGLYSMADVLGLNDQQG